MDTIRSVYSVSASNPGSDIASETAAALAAASLVSRTRTSSARVFLSPLESIGEWRNKLQAIYTASRGFHVPHTATLLLQQHNTLQLTRTSADGLMHKLSGSNLQHVTAITFLLTAYAKYMTVSGASFSCGNVQVTFTDAQKPCKKTAYGVKYPKKFHQIGSSLHAVATHPQVIGCNDGFQ
ncbi:Endoglucanase 23-like protein [Drosera capensis]